MFIYLLFMVYFHYVFINYGLFIYFVPDLLQENVVPGAAQPVPFPQQQKNIDNLLTRKADRACHVIMNMGSGVEFGVLRLPVLIRPHPIGKYTRIQ